MRRGGLVFPNGVNLAVLRVFGLSEVSFRTESRLKICFNTTLNASENRVCVTTEVPFSSF